MQLPSGQNRQKNSLKECVFFLLIRHPKYSAVLSKIHSYRLLCRRFCQLGTNNLVMQIIMQLPFFNNFVYQYNGLYFWKIWYACQCLTIYI